jgi:hypothetical protein
MRTTPDMTGPRAFSSAWKSSAPLLSDACNSRSRKVSRRPASTSSERLGGQRASANSCTRVRVQSRDPDATNGHWRCRARPTRRARVRCARTTSSNRTMADHELTPCELVVAGAAKLPTSQVAMTIGPSSRTNRPQRSKSLVGSDGARKRRSSRLGRMARDRGPAWPKAPIDRDPVLLNDLCELGAASTPGLSIPVREPRERDGRPPARPRVGVQSCPIDAFSLSANHAQYSPRLGVAST